MRSLTLAMLAGLGLGCAPQQPAGHDCPCPAPAAAAVAAPEPAPPAPPTPDGPPAASPAPTATAAKPAAATGVASANVPAPPPTPADPALPAGAPPSPPQPDRPDAPATTADLPCKPGELLALPAPTASGGLPLIEALQKRQSGRDFKPDPLPLGVLSDLLWAANGVNRKEAGKHTAATARNWQNLTVYVALAAGVFRYDPAAHALVAVKPEDLRAATGRQPFVATAPLNLVYVSDTAKATGGPSESDLQLYDGAHAGLVAQNVYLFAASAGLATVLRANLDRAALGAALALPPSERVVMAQTVGYPAPPATTP